MVDKEKIQKLKDGESYIVYESDYGRAEIWLKNETYFLFSIPEFGGIPVYERSYRKHMVIELIKEYESWV